MFDTVELTELARKAAGCDARLGSDTELLEGAVALERVRGLVDAAEAHVLAELDARGTCDREFGLKTGGWVAREAGLPVGVAAKRVQVAKRLRAVLPEVDEALSCGVIGWDMPVCSPTRLTRGSKTRSRRYRESWSAWR